MSTKKMTGYKEHKRKPLAHYFKRTVKKFTGKRTTARKVKLS